ncbi:MAG: hypothetical protein PF795_12390 [Kiritimatiellae bacterium]|jgi:hypothetical protein|nr:hypothetical protein [Kiritimatiellia bacterium]
MKITTLFTILAVGGACYGVGFQVGKYVHGHHYEIRNEEEFSFLNGTIYSRYTTDSIGPPILDPGTSEIQFHGAVVRGLPITIYKANRGFQESTPFVNDLKVRGDEVSWDDGLYSYRLHINEATEETGQQNTPPNPSGPVR